MKYLILAALMLSSCTTRTIHGDCVGVLEPKDPTLTYSYDGPNIFLAVLLSETVIVPLLVVFKHLECPDGKKDVH